MSDARPNDFREPGLSHDVPCTRCGHDHSALPCDWCPCGIASRPGIDL